MSKKKKNESMEDFLMEIIEEVAKSTGVPVNEAISMLNKELEDGKDLDDILNEEFYRYQQPDYAAMGAEHFTWLTPLWNLTMRSDVQEVCSNIYDASKAVDAEQRRKDLREYVYALFGDYYPEVPPVKWRLFGALWLMERYDLKDCLDMALEVLRQDAHFFSTYLFGVESYLVAVLYQLGHNQTDVLEKFLYEKGLIPSGKPIVFDALVMTAISMPQKRLAIVSILSKYLKYCLDICKQGADPTNIERYAFTLASAHITELLPQLRTLYNEVHIPTQILKSVEDIEEIMHDDMKLDLAGYNSLNAYLEDYDADTTPYNYDFDDKDSFFDDEDFDDDDMSYDDYYDDDDEIFDNNVSPRRITLSIELMGTSQPVRCLLKVPTNIYLYALSDLIMIAFGRTDFSNVYEFTDSNGYRFVSNEDDYEDTDDYYDIENTLDTCLKDILRKKGDTASFDIKKNGKTLWHHTVTAVKWGGRYKEKPAHYLQLENLEGTYPTMNTKNMADYEKRLKAGKLKSPNFKTIRERIRDYEDNKGVPF